MTGQRRSVRRFAAAAGVAIAVAAALGSATPAYAATGSFTSPDAGTTYDGSTAAMSTASVKATETYNKGESGDVQLYIDDPRYTLNDKDGCRWEADDSQFNATGAFANGSTTSVSTSIALTGKAYPSSCSDSYAGKQAVNGTWTALLVGSGDSTSPSRTFDVEIPPAAPTGLSGSSTSPLKETISWTANPELDTHAYEILDSSGSVLGTFQANDACNGGSCSGTVTAQTSGSQSFQVEAFRRPAPTSDPNDPSMSGDLSTKSDPLTTTVMAKPAPSPTATPTTGGGSGGSGSGGSGSGGSGSGGSGSGGSGGSGSDGSGGSGGSSGAGSSATPSADATGTASPDSAHPSSDPTQSAKPGVAGSSSGPQIGHLVTGAQAQKLSNIFQNFAPPAGIDKLPPLPVLSANGTVAGAGSTAASDDGEPTDQGTFKLSLGYSPETTTTSTTSTSTPLASVADALGVSPVGLWRSIAGSLLLLLGAAHVRRFARTSPEE